MARIPSWSPPLCLVAATLWLVIEAAIGTPLGRALGSPLFVFPLMAGGVFLALRAVPNPPRGR
ncbi:hypothetical protein P0W64_15080 [Tsukamurella sp. 8F]|uniref:hypothetical protein n=1 Tax=unclassified Tsukamurella TaxID=2633480 RepID=UPI0023B9D3C3|nr:MULTISPECIES: hypothetical protein [unclassified Tsukamurella]MDF0532531.1 hypothetical protein [Tsukamurella sp. 8J]MDF0588101.1 hypothetical protein [Tsukamurella sp. 8F]